MIVTFKIRNFCYGWLVLWPKDTGSCCITVDLNYASISEHDLEVTKLQFFVNLDCFRLQLKTEGGDLLLWGVLKQLPTQLLPQTHISN
jgi:hypothetical protein